MQNTLHWRNCQLFRPFWSKTIRNTNGNITPKAVLKSCGYSHLHTLLKAVLKVQRGKITVEKHKLSTLSTGLSTGCEILRFCHSIYIMVYITHFDNFKHISHFFLGQNVDGRKFLSSKIGLDKEFHKKKLEFF